MPERFDLNFLHFRCKHPKCGEIFEKSADTLAAEDDVICPRCGTAGQIDEESHLPAVARTSEEQAYKANPAS